MCNFCSHHILVELDEVIVLIRWENRICGHFCSPSIVSGQHFVSFSASLHHDIPCCTCLGLPVHHLRQDEAVELCSSSSACPVETSMSAMVGQEGTGQGWVSSLSTTTAVDVVSDSDCKR